jgi:FkbM family methyltransferase
LLEVLESGHQPVQWDGKWLNFAVLNSATAYRAKTVFSKEPETIRWIKSMDPLTSVLWDVGANIGLYSTLAAAKGVRVVALEPAIANLEVLQENCLRNGLAESLLILPVAVSGEVQVLRAKVPTRKLGRGASAPFLVSLPSQGSSVDLGTAALSLDSVRELFDVAPPTHLKIDVDGGEEAILRGGASILAEARSVLIEVADNPESQVAVSSMLSGLGFRRQPVSARLNQLWERSD